MKLAIGRSAALTTLLSRTATVAHQVLARAAPWFSVDDLYVAIAFRRVWRVANPLATVELLHLEFQQQLTTESWRAARRRPSCDCGSRDEENRYLAHVHSPLEKK
jgi:hypothetical protein